MYDAIVIGGGPAGLSAALILGRACRRVLLCDDGHPRNRAASALHGFLGHDGIRPEELLRAGRQELALYGVEVVDQSVLQAQCMPPGRRQGLPTLFEIRLADRPRLLARKLLLCTGVRDVLPDIEGLATYYGHSVHHCPYCDGWEHRGQRLAAFGNGSPAVGLALALRTWSERVTACTNAVPVDDIDRGRLSANGIELCEARVVGLEGAGRQLHHILLDRGGPLPCDALFFNTDQYQRSDLPAMLGCQYTQKGHVETEPRQRTAVPGLYLAGDADGDVQFAVVAAAEGAEAAVAINRELQDEDQLPPG